MLSIQVLSNSSTVLVFLERLPADMLQQAPNEQKKAEGNRRLRLARSIHAHHPYHTLRWHQWVLFALVTALEPFSRYSLEVASGPPHYFGDICWRPAALVVWHHWPVSPSPFRPYICLDCKAKLQSN